MLHCDIILELPRVTLDWIGLITRALHAVGVETSESDGKSGLSFDLSIVPSTLTRICHVFVEFFLSTILEALLPAELLPMRLLR